MRNTCLIILLSLLFFSSQAQIIGKVGINTTTPAAMLHVKDSSVVFTGAVSLPANPGLPPVSGGGIRMMWYPAKGAFRTGRAGGAYWDRDNVGNYSNVLGYNSFATAEYSNAIGYSAQATNVNAIAIGNNSVASGYGAIAIGTNPVATAEASVALCASCFSTGLVSTAFGFETHSTGESSTSMGHYSTASGSTSTAIGFNTLASGHQSTSMGVNSVASGNTSTAMGRETIAKGRASVSMGYGTQANGYSSTVIGYYNDTIVAPQTDPGAITSTTPLFIIGNGENSTTRSNAITVLKNGKIGIGTSAPAYKLDVADRMRLRTGAGGESAGIWFNKLDNSAAVAFIGMFNNEYIGIYGEQGSAWNLMMSTITGNVGIGLQNPTEKLHVTGNGKFNGSVIASCGVLSCSDIRYKTGIIPISNSLQNILSLQGIYYYWDKEKFPEQQFNDKRQIGFSAQEIEKIYPEMVHTDAEGYKSVDYSRMTPVLLEGMKEQQSQIEHLSNQVNDLSQLVIQLLKEK